MLKIGIIGSGFGLYGLLPAFNSVKNCQVVSICAKKTERLTSNYKKKGIEKIYTDWELMLKSEQLDVLGLAVTPKTQYEIAKVAIEMGINIFAEKPLSTSYKQAKELLDLATKKKVTHSVDFIFPEIEEWKKVKELLDKKLLGELKQICVNWDFLSYDIKNKISSWKTDISQGGGALSFYFSHSLYYLEYFAGEISSLKSLLSYSPESLNKGETGVDLMLKFKNGITGYAHLSCDTKGLNRHQLILICEKATIVLENQNSITENFSVKIYTEDQVKYLPKTKEKTEHNQDERVKFVQKIASRFVEACIHKKQITPSFKEGVRVQELIEKIRANSYVW